MSPTVSFAADDLAAIQRAVAAVAATPGATAEAVARAVRDQLAKLPGAQDKELELAAQAIEQETKRHVTAIAQEAEVTQGTALAIGRSLLEVWHRMGAPSGFRDAQEWVRTLVDFWWHNRDSVSALHDEVDRLEGLVAAQSAALDPVRRQEAVMSRILALADMAHNSGTPYSEEELQALIRTVYTILDGHGAPSITVLGNGGR